MVTKTLTITQSAYDKLLANKQENESFSQVIERLVPIKNPWLSLAGTITESEAKNILTDIKEMRDTNARIRHKRNN